MSCEAHAEDISTSSAEDIIEDLPTSMEARSEGNSSAEANVGNIPTSMEARSEDISNSSAEANISNLPTSMEARSEDISNSRAEANVGNLPTSMGAQSEDISKSNPENEKDLLTEAQDLDKSLCLARKLYSAARVYLNFRTSFRGQFPSTPRSDDFNTRLGEVVVCLRLALEEYNEYMNDKPSDQPSDDTRNDSELFVLARKVHAAMGDLMEKIPPLKETVLKKILNNWRDASGKTG